METLLRTQTNFDNLEDEDPQVCFYKKKDEKELRVFQHYYLSSITIFLDILHD